MENVYAKKTFFISSEYRDLLVEISAAYILEKPPDFLNFATDYLKKKIFARSSFPRETSIASVQSFYPRREAVAAEVLEEDDDDDSKPIINPKTPEEKRRLADILQDLVIFKSVDKEGIDKVIDAMQYKEVGPDEYLIREGEAGDFYYVINHGIFQAIKGAKGDEAVLYTYRNRGSFGELALMYDVPRACSVRSVTKGDVWALDRVSFQKIVMKGSKTRRDKYESLLEKSRLLRELTSYEKLNLTDALETRTFRCGERILKEGDEGDGMYFVVQGTVKATVVDRKSGVEKLVKVIEEGGYFGELALLRHKHKRRAASVYAVTDVQLAFLNAEAFERLLGPCKQILKRQTKAYRKLKY